LVFVAALALCGCASGDSFETLVSMTPEHFRDTAQILDDQLETTAIISMEPGFHARHNLAVDRLVCDAYLRAFVEKQSGATTYQLYVDASYSGHDRRLYNTIVYRTPQGIQSAPVIVISRDRANCRKDDCMHRDVVAFDMPEAMLREIAATYTPNVRNGWLFKIKGKFLDTDIEDVIMPSEAAGLLMAVKAYKASLHP
jgi:hypothetical protein